MQNPTNTESDLDQLIQETLRQDESALLEQLEEPSLRTMIGDVYSSRLRWLMVISTFFILALFVLALWAGVHFFQATEVAEQIRWGALMFLFWMGTGYMKLFHWMEMERFAIVREIKRVELRLVQMAAESSPDRVA